MRIVAGLWRWRGNPLCRETDRAEAWLTLCAALLIVLGTPLAGLAAGLAASAELNRVVAEQRRHRHPVWATTDQVLPHPVGEDGAERTAEEAGYPVLAFWKSPDGTTRTGPATAGRPVRPGDRFRVWTDEHGSLTSAPMSASTASSHAVVAGLVAGVAAAVAVEAGRRGAVRRMMRRRFARWDEEWARIGPDSGRLGGNG
ncbi:hypothetical protein HOY81_15005 [Streptomyces sp. JJ36]|nr:hypothetical protein [Streptomyces sp. JJ36]